MKKLLLAVLMVVVLLASSCAAITSGTQSTVKSVILNGTQDAYVVTDASTTDDPEGLRDQNFGTQEFVKVWYAWKIIKTEQAVSVGLFKFDLKPLEGKQIKSASLQLMCSGANLNAPARLVDVSLVDGTWDESTVTFNNRPAWGNNVLATTVVYGPGVWYNWDVSAAVASKVKDSEVSFVTGLRTMEEGKQEQVLFVAHQVAGLGPRLLVTYVEPPFTLPIWVWIIAIVVVALIAVIIALAVARRGKNTV